MTTCQQIIDTVLDMIKAKHARDTDLVIRYRPWFSTPAQDETHINLFVVPKSGCVAGLALMHTVDTYKVRVSGVTWEEIEDYYATHHIGASEFALSQLFYYATEESRRKYEKLKGRITECPLEVKITPEVIAAAEKHLKHAKVCFANLCIDDNILDAAKVLDTLCDCLCKLNSAHPRHGAAALLEEMKGFAHLPDGFINTFANVVHASPDTERAKALCKTLIRMVDCYIKAHKHTLTCLPPDKFLPGRYELFLENWDAIITHCEKGDATAVYFAAMQLQHWLTLIESNQNKALPDDLQLFKKFDVSKIDKFHEHVIQSRRAFLAFLDSYNVSVSHFDSPDDIRVAPERVQHRDYAH